MKSNISANIHHTNTDNKTCVVSIYDGVDLIVQNVNIGLELNPDGTANTQWIKANIKSMVADHRFHEKELNSGSSDILVSIPENNKGNT